jgi:hypothetical protein
MRPSAASLGLFPQTLLHTSWWKEIRTRLLLAEPCSQSLLVTELRLSSLHQPSIPAPTHDISFPASVCNRQRPVLARGGLHTWSFKQDTLIFTMRCTAPCLLHYSSFHSMVGARACACVRVCVCVCVHFNIHAPTIKWVSIISFSAEFWFYFHVYNLWPLIDDSKMLQKCTEEYSFECAWHLKQFTSCDLLIRWQGFLSLSVRQNPLLHWHPDETVSQKLKK